MCVFDESKDVKWDDDQLWFLDMKWKKDEYFTEFQRFHNKFLLSKKFILFAIFWND